jgi:hypothetical protein
MMLQHLDHMRGDVVLLDTHLQVMVATSSTCVAGLHCYFLAVHHSVDLAN